MTQTDIFTGLDPRLLIFAALTAASLNVLMALRARNRLVLSGQPVPPLHVDALIVDMLLGTVVGVGLALGVPELVPRLHTFTGALMLSGVGGILGPKVLDTVVSDGLDILLDALARIIGGPLKTWSDKRKEAPSLPAPPAPAPTPAPAPAPQEVRNDTP